MVKLAILAVAAFCQSVLADKLYNFNIGWVNAAPDGVSRPVIGINGKWPIPTIEADVGEKITVQVTNNLGNETTSLHFHGLRQFHSNEMDGPSAVTQCPIPPGGSYTYTFIADAPGSYWYHSHNMGQYPDGLRGPLKIHDPNASYAGKVSAEYDLVLSDWYHKQSVDIIRAFQSPPAGPPATPIPDSIIMNDGQSSDYSVQPGKTYLFRIYNVGAFPSFFLNFQDLDMTVVGIDGVSTQPTPATTLYIGAAQRYEVLVTAKNSTTADSAILAMVDMSMFEIPAGTPGAYTGPQWVFGHLCYPGNMSAAPDYQNLPASILPPIDDTTIKPLDAQPLLGPVTKQIVIDYSLTLLGNPGIPRAIVNGNTYLAQKVPTLFTAMSAPQNLKADPSIYGVNSNSFYVEFGDVVEVVINNQTPTGHPWHLHGHQFQVVARGDVNSSYTSPYNPATADPVPMKRDVAGVLPGGFVVFRFKADNPGIQLLHCHIEWHVEAGLSATILEATDLINSNNTSNPNAVNVQLSKDATNNCQIQGIPLTGNAAGNSVNWLDLTGANTQVPSVNNGAVYTANQKRSRIVRRSL